MRSFGVGVAIIYYLTLVPFYRTNYIENGRSVVSSPARQETFQEVRFTGNPKSVSA